PPEEVEGLMQLFKKNFEEITSNQKIHKNKVQVRAVGKLELLPEDVREAIKKAEESTASYKQRRLNIAIGYDGRMEIVDAIKKIVNEVESGKLDVDDIDENIVNRNLYT